MISKAGGRRHGVHAKSITRRGKSGWSPATVSLSAPCKILDVSKTSVRIENRLFVCENRHALQLMLELDHGRTLSCGLQVVHVRSPRFGSKSPRSVRRIGSNWPISSTIAYRQVTHAGSPFPSYCLISWAGPHRPYPRLKTRSSISRSSASGT